MFIHLAGWLVLTSCAVSPVPADTDAIASLDALRDNGQAVARVYAASIPVIAFAEHTWFVVKRADSTKFHRWEVFVFGGGIYDYIHEDLFGLEADLGAGGTRVLGELIGPEAERVVDFLENQSANYACRDFYRFAEGPNSNGFTQWVLEQTGWDVQLPGSAIGKDVRCPL